MDVASGHVYQCQSCGGYGSLSTSALGNGAIVCPNVCTSCEVDSRNPSDIGGQCGLTSDEAGIRMQDELASMFKQNMHLSRAAPVPQIILPGQKPVTYCASQHYHHSAHITSPRADDVMADASEASSQGRPEGAADAEPYMKSGYEALAERDQNRQTAQPSARETFKPLGTAIGQGPPANSTALSPLEWWRNFTGNGASMENINGGTDRHNGGGLEMDTDMS